MKRAALVTVSVAAALLILGSLAAWLILSAWVPQDGKALLIREVERQAPVHLSIGAIRYDLFQGFVLSDVQVTERASRQPWCTAPCFTARVGWPALLFTRTVALHGHAKLTQPIPTEATVAVHYALRNRALAIDLETTECPIRSITAPLARAVPAAISDGDVRLRLHVRRAPAAAPVLMGDVTGHHLVWTAASWRAGGDVTLEGSASPPPSPGGRWTWEGRATLRQGALQGVPIAGAITSMNGTARLQDDAIQIETLSGTTLDSTWTLEGTVSLGATPSLEALVRSHASLPALANMFPDAMRQWHPEGAADLRAMCRGRLAPTPALDCQIGADVHEATLAGEKLSQPLTGLTGAAGYDLWARRLSIKRLAGRLANRPFAIAGEIRLAPSQQLALSITGTVSLDALAPWLPTPSPVEQLGGIADVNVMVNGPPSALRCSGKVALTRASLRLAPSGIAITELTGTAHLLDNHAEIANTTLTLNGHPLTLTATIAPIADGGSEAANPLNYARIAAVVTTPEARMTLAGRVMPDALILDEGGLALAHSALRIAGRMSREADHASLMSITGTLDLAELSHLPFLPLPALEAWKLRGTTEARLQFDGRLSDWRESTIDGELRADHVQIREIPLDQATCIIEQHHRLLRMHIPSALAADGKLWGELVIEHHPEGAERYLLQADAVNLQLASLTQAIPAWQSHAIAGAASSHVLLSGAWAQRPTWKGEGWLNATGERLGDVPLLDKLFRGLFGVLGERLGLDSLRRAQITQASLRWQLSQERFRTDDLRLSGAAGAEPVAIYAKGSVGFDRTLDFVIEPELSEGVMLEAPTTATLARTVLKAAGQLERLRRLIGRHRLTGTLDKPEYRFEITTQDLFKQLAPSPVDILQSLFDAVR